MKKHLLLIFLCLTSVGLWSQVNNPTTWQFSQKETAVNEYELTFKATIIKGWHLYSMNIEDGGPVKTSFSFETTTGAELISEITAQSKEIRKMDEIFGMEIGYYETEAIFSQKVKILADAKISGYVEFMSCDDESCTPPQEESFEFNIAKKEVAETPAPLEVVDTIPEPNVVKAVIHDVAKNEVSKPEKTEKLPSKEEVKPKEEEVKPNKTGLVFESIELNKTSDNQNTDTITSISEAKAKKTETVDSQNNKDSNVNRWAIFLIAFGSGFLALLTPCVFPMIPMTVSYFTKQSKTKAVGIRNATIYGIFIVLIYVILGSLVTIIFGADALNALSTNPWFNVFFFVLLVVFAISFLGAFEITLPSSWVNKADKGADKGGLLGIFFMALTLALVSFSCTGPIVGTLLVQAASSGGLAPAIGMLGFGLALALPFALFAAFPGYLNSLPKSGGWLNSVKVVLGFVELALAFKFLSNADLVLDLHLLEREVFIAIWIAIFGALSFYLLGKLRLPHDSAIETLSVSRLILGLITLSFTIYMIPGLWGAPLKIISAFPPPMEYAESPEGVGYKSTINISESQSAIKLGENMHAGPQNIPVFHNYDDALAYAKEVNKPLMLDFTGKACVNCRQMEINVWSNPEINALMKNDFVVAALYVDYRKKLPENEQFTSSLSGKTIRTEGQKWSDFQISRYNTNSQPYYVLLDHNEELLNTPRAFDLDIKEYQEWLNDGLNKFKN